MFTDRGIQRILDKGLHGRHSAGSRCYGLAINVHCSADGSATASWVQRLSFDGRRLSLGLGPWPVIDCERAQRKALDNLRMALDGIDPRTGTAPETKPTPAPEPKTIKAPTKPKARAKASKPLREHHASYVTALETAPKKPHPKTIQQWHRQFEMYVWPVLGDKAAADITAADVLDVLGGIGSPTPQRNVRDRLAILLDVAQERGEIERNVARGISRSLIRRKPAENRKACDWREAHEEFSKVLDADGFEMRARLFAFVVLTACRTTEARLARWSEIDLESATWTIPADRTKTEHPYRFALSREAVNLLREIEPTAEHVFTGENGKPLAESWAAAQRRLFEAGWHHHGWRSTFSDWALDNGYSSDLADSALMHSRQGTKRSYQRTDRLEERREMMEAWSQHLLG